MRSLFLFACLALTSAAARAAPPLEDIRLPRGFAISLYAEGMPEARSLALGDRGTLFVGSRSDKVYAVPPGGGKPRVVASGLEAPHGVAFRDGALYVADVGRILRYDRIEERLDDPPQPAVVADDLPAERGHGLKTLRFGPDGLLYYAVGSPCNVCEPRPGYGTIIRFDPASPGRREIYARGIRNSVGFDWDPRTGELWFTDNGRDNLGDDVPPDELNRAPRAGLHFGFPYCHAGDVADPRYGAQHACREFTPPALKLGPHVASLGMRFYTGKQFPAPYRGAIFIAEHGSWNRSRKIGYRVSVVKDPARPSYEVFAEGWLEGQGTRGRPVDVIVAPDGALLVSDDRNGVVYRIGYGR
ncbi:MAG TPA: PQQ-dependent sugar dehydrogenase [Burkholderiales bacterium]